MIALTIEIAGRLAALIAAIGWGISVVGLVVPSATAFDLLQGLGADGLAYHPMLDYWLRMAAFAFTAIGVQFLVVAVWWRRLTGLALAGALFQILSGCVLLISAAAIGLDAGNHRADAAFCLSTGTIMLAAAIIGRRLTPTRIHARWWRRLVLAWRRPGHPWEVAAITAGLALWPYFTGARLIAPLLDPGHTTEYRPGFLPVILLLLGATFAWCAIVCPRTSTPLRRNVMRWASAFALAGLIEYLLIHPTGSMAREMMRW